jgi:hypothetical protein
MVKKNYNPDEDYTGHTRADYLIKKFGSIENAPKLRKRGEKPNPLEKTLEILKNSNPDLINFGNGKEFERILNKIIKTGYVIKNSYNFPIKDFSRLDGPQKRNIYISLKKEFNLL